MTFLAVLATIVGMAMGLSGFPQAVKIFKRKCAKDIALLTYIVLVLGGFVWVLYGIEIKSFPVVISNSIGIVSSASVLFGCRLYGKAEGPVNK